MERRDSQLLRLAGVVLGLTLVISAIILLIGLILQWNTPQQFSNAFFIVGAVAFVLGFLSVSGGFAQRASFNMTYSESAGNADLSQRAQHMISEIHQRYGALLMLGLIGALLILISLLIGNFLVM